MHDELQTSYLTDLEFSVIAHGEGERLFGSCADFPEDDTPNLQISDFERSWVLFGGRAAARAFASRILELVTDDSVW